MKLPDIIISVFVITLLTTGLFVYIGELGEYHDVEFDSDVLPETQTAMERQENATLEFENMLNTSVTDEGAFDNPYRLIVSGWRGIVLMGKSITTARTIIGEIGNVIADKLHLPKGVVNVIGIILTLTLLSMLIYTVMKWRIES